jgi:N-acetylglucosaminyl-diphospho-decaprenol L-rhamnosyltransferase
LPSQIDISVIIVSYNCLEPLRDCLNSLSVTEKISSEITVVDNDSRDGTPEYLRSLRIKAIFPGKNLGYGAAVNLGAAEVHGKYILVTNPDTIYTPDILKSLYDFAESHPKAGLVAPLLLHPDGTVQISARAFPRRRDLALGRGSLVHKLGLSDIKKAGYFENIGTEPQIVPTVPATAVLLSSVLFKKLNGFDKRYFMYMEDIDLCRRVTDLGYEIWILPPVKIKHSWRQSTSKRPYFASFYHHVSVYKYFIKFHPREYLKNSILFLMLIAGFILNSIVMALKGIGK